MKVQIDAMLAAADEASALLKALANRHRLIIICQLSERARSVGELASLLDIRDSTVSQHLALLRKDGLVAARRDGQTIWYSIASAPARQLVRTLNRVYCAPARQEAATARPAKTGASKAGAKKADASKIGARKARAGKLVAARDKSPRTALAPHQ